MTYLITLSDQEYAALAAATIGVHYPGDILGGAIDGTVAACVATALR